MMGTFIHYNANKLYKLYEQKKQPTAIFEINCNKCQKMHSSKENKMFQSQKHYQFMNTFKM